jgi:predicted CXXCH cytochrome family protein
VAFRALTLLLASLVFGQEPGAILAPPPNSAHPPASAVRFIGRGAAAGVALKLDGQPVATHSPHDGVHTAELKPSKPGIHELEFEGQKLRFSIGAEPGFVTFKPHPSADRCETCHAVRNGRWRFQRISLASVCSQCHSKESFPAKHTHEMAVLTDCQLCHNPHGSATAAPAHLKLARDAACKQCHALQ